MAYVKPLSRTDLISLAVMFEMRCGVSSWWTVRNSSYKRGSTPHGFTPRMPKQPPTDSSCTYKLRYHICGLQYSRNDVISSAIITTADRFLVNKELGMIFKETLLNWWRCCPCASLEGLRESTKYISLDSRCPSQDGNSEPPEYKTRVLPLQRDILVTSLLVLKNLILKCSNFPCELHAVFDFTPPPVISECPTVFHPGSIGRIFSKSRSW